MTLTDAFPLACLDHVGRGALALGVDLGTTTGKTSNPTALALVEAHGMERLVRLAARWKTDKPDVTKGVLVMLCAELVRRRKALRVVRIDSSNERFFAADCRTALAGLARVDLAILGSKVEYRGEAMTLKTRACGRVEAAAMDNRLRLPRASWIQKDLRQMVKDAGRYEAAVEADGSHADFFIALALALDGLESSGPGEAAAVPLSSSGAGRRGWEDEDDDDDAWKAGTLAA